MHRSGTSSLAGSLEESGVYLGQVSQQNEFNPKGNRENKRIISFHNKLFKENGGSWDSPPRTIIWKKKHQKLRDKIIRGFEGHRTWGFKDPRTLFTVEGWLEAIPDLTFVGIFRSPMLVAESLKRRNNFPLERGISLWCEYNEKLVKYKNLFDFPIVSFDEDADQFMTKTDNLIHSLGLGLNRKGETFFDPKLRQPRPKEEKQIPEKASRIYKSLQKMVI